MDQLMQQTLSKSFQRGTTSKSQFHPSYHRCIVSRKPWESQGALGKQAGSYFHCREMDYSCYSDQ